MASVERRGANLVHCPIDGHNRNRIRRASVWSCCGWSDYIEFSQRRVVGPGRLPLRRFGSGVGTSAPAAWGSRRRSVRTSVMVGRHGARHSDCLVVAPGSSQDSTCPAHRFIGRGHPSCCRRAGSDWREYRTCGIGSPVRTCFDPDDGNILDCSWFDRRSAVPAFRICRIPIERHPSQASPLFKLYSQTRSAQDRRAMPESRNDCYLDDESGIPGDHVAPRLLFHSRVAR
jgi:hypothetical protein